MLDDALSILGVDAYDAGRNIGKALIILIGAAGVSAVPMSARVVNKVGIEANPHNFLLMHAMGPNVAGVIGSAIVAGYFLSVIPY